jgi:(E)-4-hydroxy-3-methylbut-2-enyl-diphosphate synthase
MAKEVKIGNVMIGGSHPVAIQSMLSVPSTDLEGSVAQAVELEEAGCEILRAAVPDMEAVRLIPAIKEKIHIPLVADIHFDYRLALAAVEAGADKIRINPGNIGGEERTRAVAEACGKAGAAIRIGVNRARSKNICSKNTAPDSRSPCRERRRICPYAGGI